MCCMQVSRTSSRPGSIVLVTTAHTVHFRTAGSGEAYRTRPTRESRPTAAQSNEVVATAQHNSRDRRIVRLCNSPFTATLNAIPPPPEDSPISARPRVTENAYLEVLPMPTKFTHLVLFRSQKPGVWGVCALRPIEYGSTVLFHRNC